MYSGLFLCQSIHAFAAPSVDFETFSGFEGLIFFELLQVISSEHVIIAGYNTQEVVRKFFRNHNKTNKQLKKTTLLKNHLNFGFKIK